MLYKEHFSEAIKELKTGIDQLKNMSLKNIGDFENYQIDMSVMRPIDNHNEYNSKQQRQRVLEEEQRKCRYMEVAAVETREEACQVCVDKCDAAINCIELEDGEKQELKIDIKNKISNIKLLNKVMLFKF